jgi:hypothetical protein
VDLHITEEERRELRRALNERKDELQKLKKKAEERGVFSAAMDFDYHIRLITGGPGEESGLLDKLMDPAVDGTGRSLFDRDDNPDVEDVLDGIEEEAAQRIRARQAHEAFIGALPEVPMDSGATVSDADLAEYIAAAWDEVVGTIAGVELAGLHTEQTLDGATVHCHLVGGPTLMFFSHTDPTEPMDEDAEPYLYGDALLAAARRVYWPQEQHGTAAEPEADEAEQEQLDEADVAELAAAGVVTD